MKLQCLPPIAIIALKAPQSKAPQSKAKQSKGNQNKAEQSKAKKSKAPPSKAKQSRAKESKTKQSKAKQRKAKHPKAKKSKVPLTLPAVCRHHLPKAPQSLSRPSKIMHLVESTKQGKTRRRSRRKIKA